MDFNKYASQYDHLIKYKPSYHQLLEAVLSSLLAYLPFDGPHVIADFGAGTGNFTQLLADRYLHAKIFAVELNDGFIAQLRNKTFDRKNIQIVQANIEDQVFPEESCDAIVMIHVLRLTENADQNMVFRKVHRQLKNGGYFLIADIGRKLNTKKHTLEIVRNAYENVGIFGLIRLYFDNIYSIRFNRKCSKLENIRPNHMLHTVEELSKRIESCGFKILVKRNDLYLGDDDFIVARKL